MTATERSNLEWCLHFAGGSTNMPVVQDFFRGYTLQVGQDCPTENMRCYHTDPNSCVSHGGVIYFCHFTQHAIDHIPKVFFTL
jgi:hypothetical protein